ncbi:hypothetical protein PUR49_05435 [Streptomyces sp. BE147]|uniref:hypothetical protein n=1 Tax=Streptomyces sp. BE147 TaxID=3002524 RepID=UPI002E79D5A7|nr:hypothetical protein [Streptomyces sp. BE147]MEE1735957.1 hypothetical protein [Streptomyces sp. BE147]
MATYVIRRRNYPDQIASGTYQWTAVIATDGSVSASAVRAVERYGRTWIETPRPARPFVAELMTDIRREPGMSRAELIELRLFRA